MVLQLKKKLKGAIFKSNLICFLLSFEFFEHSIMTVLNFDFRDSFFKFLLKLLDVILLKLDDVTPTSRHVENINFISHF